MLVIIFVCEELAAIESRSRARLTDETKMRAFDMSTNQARTDPLSTCRTCSLQIAVSKAEESKGDH